MIRLQPFEPFQNAFVIALPHGIVAGVHLPPAPEPVSAAVLGRLHTEERAFAESCRGFRQVQFAGGRLALASVLNELGERRVAVLPNEHGAPQLPAGLVGSISHKQDLAVAVVARGSGGIGIDIEDCDQERPGVARRVLRAEELSAVELLPPERRWCDTVVRFSVKEAVYKALHPFFRRYIGFEEVNVWPSPDGCDRVESRFVAPTDGRVDPRVRIDARHTWLGRRVLSTVRVSVEPAGEPRR